MLILTLKYFTKKFNWKIDQNLLQIIYRSENREVTLRITPNENKYDKI